MILASRYTTGLSMVSSHPGCQRTTMAGVWYKGSAGFTGCDSQSIYIYIPSTSSSPLLDGVEVSGATVTDDFPHLPEC